MPETQDISRGGWSTTTEREASARKIMEKPAYALARRVFYVADRDSGEVLETNSARSEYVHSASKTNGETVCTPMLSAPYGMHNLDER
jgi:hypothetical protein